MDKALERDNIINESLKKERLKMLSKKQKEKTVLEEERAFYYMSKFLTKLIQIFCAALASCGVSALIGDFMADKTAVLIGTIALLCIMEYFIHKGAATTIRNHIKAVKLKVKPLVITMILVVISVTTTFLGSEATIHYFKIAPTLISASIIEDSFNTKIALDNKKWNNKSLAFESIANTIHINSETKGVTGWNERPAELKARTSSKEMIDSLTKHESILLAAKSKAMLEAVKTNQVTLSKHTKDKDIYTNSLKYVSIVSYVVLVALLYFIEQHEIREKKDLEVQLKDKEDIKNPTTESEVKDLKDGLKDYKEGIKSEGKDKVKDKGIQIVNKVQESTAYKAGDIKTFDHPTKKARIFVPKKDGSLKECKVSELNNWINNTSTDERKKELKSYLNKLEQHGRA